LKILHTGPEPVRANDSDAGYDLCAKHGAVIHPKYTQLIKTGLAMEIPAGYAGFVCSRSGLALKHSVFVLNAPGIIDPAYRGDIGVVLHNSSHHSYEVMEGDRVAQLVILKVEHPFFIKTSELTDTVRGTGGFGSTGS
jgi:dUTP pyrophosphatase